MNAGFRLSFVAALMAFCTWVTAAEPTPPPPTELPSSDTASQYRIGPGDVLQVFVWRETGLTTTVPVRPDGKITTPLVEDMVAVGKTPSQLARDIEKVLTKYIRSPQVNIVVSQPMSAFACVAVTGSGSKMS